MLTEQRLAAMQIGVFEGVWPAYDWIQRILVWEDSGIYEVFVQVESAPSEAEWNDCKYSLDEVLTIVNEEMAVLGEAKVSYKVLYGRADAARSGYQEIMSEDIFREIAAVRAPGRLNLGC